ncbi:MAG: 50S ribosomal protein L32 [Candidatus Lambdaproteobacteria bacterium RIFOXYD1_FULL_56_27]|uniref:Large ribosomal subunit protein bL32 n=1 Tax=Candidatus Lambdaproteobacteria bacterium RIFOXYD2_FULL_56_26 TaxID=1817773 RepID=A0A1F6H3J7_9PROT|nr:MAG: 50S ribosomal protein L32 [Candidatus Lambdaproteobacteria bacterium RIFOXYC1_FULL_56_13]OGH04945.1 MAG: 50S ribosomal protein L32 [Candidatus Lambdaproteobacteria bacterium RIFOXYD2_FULL_56_26]OGH09410.1 MAG: 50S ribosomal protein L32 [Candidatus Lambdaproteobacteria bacterium RIFOXYD1_FULL_56_27]
MPVPKRRTSRSVTRSRRNHKKMPVINFTPCPACGELTPSHKVCPKCGQYAGKQVVEVEA